MKKMFLAIEKAENSQNWQETGKLEEKKAAARRQIEK